jgi:hypothetical protein
MSAADSAILTQTTDIHALYGLRKSGRLNRSQINPEAMAMAKNCAGKPSMSKMRE